MNVWAIQHRTCGHIAGAGNDRALAEHKRDHLAAAGYHQWRVRSMPVVDAAVELAADAKCDVCRIDPTRAQLLLDERGACRVCTGGVS